MQHEWTFLMITLEKTEYKGWENCLRPAHEPVGRVLSTDEGTRIISDAVLLPRIVEVPDVV